MAKVNYYKFVNPGAAKTGATIAGKKYQTKGGGGETERKLVLTANRIGLALNSQGAILSSIKKSIDDSTRASIVNARLVSKSIQGIQKEDRERKKQEAAEKRRLAREARIRASRARLGAKEDALEAKAKSSSSTEEDDTFPEAIGFRKAFGKFIKTLLTFVALKWLSNLENAKTLARLLVALVDVLKVLYKIVEFGVFQALEGFTNMFASDSNFFDRLKGFLQFLVGAFSLFFTVRWLKNPLKIIKDIRGLFRGLRLIPKALGLAAKAGKAVVMATKAGVMKMRGRGLVGGALAIGGTVLLGSALMSGGESGGETGGPGPSSTPTGGTGGAAAPAPDTSMATGGIVPFRMPSAQAGARIIKGRNQGYRTTVGGRQIEAHGAEAVIPLKNRYTDAGNDPLAAVLGNSKKMAEAMGALITLPLKMAGGAILVGLGTLLGMAPGGVGGMLAPIAKSFIAPVLNTFGVPSSLLDQAMANASKTNAGKEFGNVIGDVVKDWFGKLLPGSPAAAATRPPSVTGDGGDGTGDGNGSPLATPAVSGSGNERAVLDLIASVESNGSYDVFNTSRGKTNAKATEKTVGWLADNAQGAIGRYQQMPRYLLERATAAGYDRNTKFTPEVQDKVTLKMLRSGHSLDSFLSGKTSPEAFAAKLAPTWRGLPQGPSAASRLGGTADSTYNDRYASGNKSHKTWTATVDALKKAQGQRMNRGGMVIPRYGLGGFFDTVGKAIGGVFNNPIGKAVAGIAGAAIPGAAPIIAGIGALGGLASGNPLGAITSAASAFFPGASNWIGGVGSAIGGFMSGNPIGGIASGLGSIFPGMGGIFDAVGGALSGGGFGQIIAQGGEMIFGPGFTQLFGGTLDLLNVGGKGLGASEFLKKMAPGLMDYGVKQIAGTMGGPDAKNAFVPGGSTVLNVNAVKMISGLMKAQQVQQNSAKIEALSAVTTTLGDKLVKVTGDVIAGVLVDKNKMAELPPAVVQEGMSQILPLIQQAIVNASQTAAQQASTAGGGTTSGLAKSASGESLTSTIAGTIGSLAGKVLGGGIK